MEIKYLTTREAAAILRVRPERLLQAFNTRGRYYSATPIQRYNGKLDWIEAEVHALANATSRVAA